MDGLENLELLNSETLFAKRDGNRLCMSDVMIEVPFHDVDTMDVVWHGHYLKVF